MHALPPQFVSNVMGAWPVKGPQFLARLPHLLEMCKQRWGLRLLPPFTLSYNYVAPAVMPDESEVVLKLGVPNPELSTEIAALELYDGQGAVRLIEATPDDGILLMERVLPGAPLGELDDDGAAIIVAAEMMQRLWRPLPPHHPFPDLWRWTRTLRAYAGQRSGTGPLPPELMKAADHVLSDLLASSPTPVLIHGDFHHWNILRAEREPWLVIDPKGVAAEPAFEVGPLLYNPIPQVLTWPHLRRITARRIDLLTEHLRLDRQRLTACGFVGAMLSACWSTKDGDGASPDFLAFAQILRKLLQS